MSKESDAYLVYISIKNILFRVYNKRNALMN